MFYATKIVVIFYYINSKLIQIGNSTIIYDRQYNFEEYSFVSMNILTLQYSQSNIKVFNLSIFNFFSWMEEQKCNKMHWINKLTEEYLLVLGLFCSIYKPYMCLSFQTSMNYKILVSELMSHIQGISSSM